MARYLDVKKDDELFAARLQEVNREMDTLLHKTSRTRHEMDRAAAEARMGVPLSFHRERGSVAMNDNNGAIGNVYQPRTFSPLAFLSSTLYSADSAAGAVLRDDLTRGVVSAELTQWVRTHLPAIIAPLVDTQVHKHLHELRNTVADVQTRQAEVEKSVKEVTEQLPAHRRDMQTGLTAIERSVQRNIDEHQRLTEGRLGALREEMQRVKDELRALQEQRSGEVERMDRRLEEVLQRRQQQMQDTFASLDRDFQRWRQFLQKEVEKDVQTARVQHDALENHVAQLQGALSSIADVAARCSVELQRIMGDAVCRSSEVRLCRRDVNRLEMLVQCSALQVTGISVPVRDRKESHNNNKDTMSAAADGVAEIGLHTLQPYVALTAEVAHINDKIQAVVARMDSLDRQVRQLDVAIARGAAATTAVSIPRGFFENLRDLGEDSLNNRSSAPTRHPGNSQLSSVHTASCGGIGSLRQAQNPGSVLYHDGSGSRTSVGTSDLHNRPEWNNNTAFLIPAVQPPFANSSVPHRMEAIPTRVDPKTSEVQLPPTPHFSTNSLPFEDDAEDPQPMPIIANASRAAPGVTSNELVASRNFAGGSHEGSSLPRQRRAPPRVIPVEQVPTLAGTKAIMSTTNAADAAAAATPSGGSSGTPYTPPTFSAKSPPRSAGNNRSSNNISSHNSTLRKDQDNGSADQGSSSDREHTESPHGYSLNRCRGTYGADNSGSRNSGNVPQRSGGDCDGQVLAAASPSDSYVSDTPAAAPSAEDSYVSDTPAPTKVVPATPKNRFDRYIPAPVSDSEDGRDNEVILRSALD